MSEVKFKEGGFYEHKDGALIFILKAFKGACGGSATHLFKPMYFCRTTTPENGSCPFYEQSSKTRCPYTGLKKHPCHPTDSPRLYNCFPIGTLKDYTPVSEIYCKLKGYNLREQTPDLKGIKVVEDENQTTNKKLQGGSMKTREKTSKRNEEIVTAIKGGATKEDLMKAFNLSKIWTNRILTSLRKQNLIDKVASEKPAEEPKSKVAAMVKKGKKKAAEGSTAGVAE